MPSPFSVYAGSNPSSLTNALFATNSGITASAIALQASGQDAVNFYDGSLTPLGIGKGLLLTSGTTPGTSNTLGWFGTDNSGSNFYNGDADIDAVVNTVFSTQSYDATTLSFDFTVTDPAATSVSFDVVFGSDEYPEWVDQFVDCAVVMVNGVNHALFNHDPMHPLSVVSSNLAAGYFQDNAGNALPIEYDGVSQVLKIVAPITPGGVTNHIKIGIADTGDHIYDSGIFLANFSAGNIPGSGVVIAPTTGTAGSDTLTGSSKDEYFDLKGGDDTVYAGAGDDIVVAGSGNDIAYGGSGADQLKGEAGDDFLDGGADLDTAVYAGKKTDFVITFDGASQKYTVKGPASEGTDTLTGVEFAQFSDGLWSLGSNGTVSEVSSTGTVSTPTNQPGTLFLSGVGGQGQTLTATVSDADGVPTTGITYAWQADGVDLVGVSGKTFVVGSAQVGKNITVTAAYTDLAGYSESLISAAKSISAPGNGDFAITLLNLSAPIGASVKNPLTTLVKNAIDLGVSPNEAGIIVKGALGIASTVDLQHYDAWAALQANPGDAAALIVEKKAVQVAVMTSLGSDETGMALTQAILLAHSNKTTLNLTDKTVIANLLGLDPSNPLVKEIWDRNDTIGSAKSIGAINTIWLDMQSGLSVVLSSSIGTLSEHINQAPTGSATASLVDGLENTDYILSANDLLKGFSDPEKDPLSVVGLSASNGSVADKGNGSFTITPDPNFNGPVELTYQVIDGKGGSAPASQLLVIAPNPVVNSAPTGQASATLAAGTEDTAYAVNASELLTGFSDANGDTLSVDALIASNGTVTDNLDGTFTITPTANFNGAVTLTYNVIDGNGGSVSATQGYTLAAVNDAPTGEVMISGTTTQGQTLTAANTLTDVDGLGAIGYQWLSNGVPISGATGSTLVLGQTEVGKVIRVTASYTDKMGTAESVTSTATGNVANVDDTATGTLAVTGTAAEGGSLVASLTNVVDSDGTTTTAYQWQENSSGIWSNLAGQNNATLAIPSDQSFVGKSVRVVATTTDVLGGTTDFNGSAQTIANVNDAPTGNVTISGTATQGQILNVYNTLADADGLGTISYQWQAAGTDIGGATGTSYTLTQAEVGKAIAVTASYTDKMGTAESMTSMATGNVAGVGVVTGVTLTGTSHEDTLKGGVGDDMLYGLEGNDKLNGGAGNDILDGGPGRDEMAGGMGNDTYYVDSTGDSISEEDGEGSDTVISSLPAYTLDGNLENLTLSGAGASNGTGNERANILMGNDVANILVGKEGNDLIEGGAGDDLLIGGAGNDTLTGGTGADIFRFDNVELSARNNLDKILDFASGYDSIQLENDIFKKLMVAGVLSADNFCANGKAVDANDFIVYDTSSGALYYDADGSGKGAAVQFATLVGHPAITATDFIVI
ncbi:serralysin [Gammaproteobacteria bacterium]